MKRTYRILSFALVFLMALSTVTVPSALRKGVAEIGNDESGNEEAKLAWGFETREEAEAWTAFDDDEDGHNWFWTGTEEPEEGPRTGADTTAYDGEYCMNSYSGSGFSTLLPNNWLISPEIKVNSGNAELSFWYGGGRFGTDHLSVYVFDDIDGRADAEAVESYDAANAFKDAKISLGSYSGKTVRIAFRHLETNKYNTMYNLKIDSVEITDAELVGQPEASDEPSEQPTEEPTEEPTEAPTEEPTEDPAEEPTEEPSDEPAEIAESWDFETFEESVLWTKVDGDEDGHIWYWSDDLTYANWRGRYDGWYLASGENCMVTTSDFYVDDRAKGYVELKPDNWLISPEFTVEKENAQLSYYYAGYDRNISENLTVYVIDGETNVVLAEESTSEGLKRGVVELDKFVGKTIKAAFRHHDSVGGYFMTLDLVQVIYGKVQDTPTPKPTAAPTAAPSQKPTEVPDDTPEPTPAATPEPEDPSKLPETKIIGFLVNSLRTTEDGIIETQPEQNWVTFMNNKPEELTVIGQMPENTAAEVEAGSQIAGAQIIGDKVYGYTRDNVYFILDYDELKQGFVDVIFYNAFANITTDCLLQYVAGVSYDPTTDTLYAMVNGANFVNGRSYSSCLGIVDRETGDIINFTEMIPVHGSLDGESMTQEMCAFAVAEYGTAYCMTDTGFSSSKQSQLCFLNLQTGEYVPVGGTTGMCGAWEQCMAYDRENGILYWAQYAKKFMAQGDNDGRLCTLDMDTGLAKVIGHIGAAGGQMTALLLETESSSNPPESPTPPTTPPETEPPVQGIPGDANGNGSVEVDDALIVMRHALGLTSVSDEAAALCDMDGDGKLLVADGLTIARKAMGIVG